METSITLQELLIATADMARDLSAGVTSATQAARNKMEAAGLAGRRPNHWQNSEVFFAEPDATNLGRTGTYPFVVTGYADGIFTLNKDFGASGVPSGLNFYIVRNHGQGNPYRAYLGALKRAIDNVGVHSRVVIAGGSTSSGVYTYTIPAGIDTLYGVTIENGSYGPYELRPDQWAVEPGRTLRLARNVTVAFPWTMKLHGRLWAALPGTHQGTVVADLDEVVSQALEELFRTSDRQAAQAKGANLQAERIRFRSRHAYPNEVRII